MNHPDYPSAPEARQRPGAEPFFHTFAADFDRHYIYSDGGNWTVALRLLVGTHSFWPLMAYRFGRALKTRPIPIVNPVLWIVFRILEFLTRIATGIALDVDARIGPGFYIGHFSAIYVGPGVVIGKHCSMAQMSVIAGDGSWPDTPAPVIGDRVYMAPGTKIIGPVTIGNDAACGANAVILDDVPPMATVVGNPATVVNHNGSAAYLRLRAADRRAPKDC